jgi:acyl-CoA reductase-like NAD-dependent aldehyde dehydrogenase
VRQTDLRRKKKQERSENFCTPTPISDVSPDTMPKAFFGPIMLIIPFSTLDEANETASCTPYWLGASI